ncbi:mariner Mos1 transposase [Trichonephila clavipes]|nr:mariner Mos1 transposase [Trichonephila clavipes]
MEWRSPASPGWKKVRAEKSRMKTMLNTLFDSQSIIHKKFLPKGMTMNAARYIEILTRFMKRLRRVRPQYTQQSSRLFIQAMLTLTQLISSNSSWQKKGVIQIEHPTYSPDLSPPDFLLFPLLKLALKGKRFDIQRNVTRLLNSIPKVDFLQSFQDMYSRSQQAIVMKGD